MGRKRTNTQFVKSRGRRPWFCGTTFYGRVGNEGVDINWDTSPVSSPFTVLSHRGEFKKDHHHYQHLHYHPRRHPPPPPPPPPPPHHHHHHHLHYHHHRHYLQHDSHHFN